MTGAADFNVRLLGPPVIEHDGEALRVDTRKAIALLAILAVERRSHARPSIAALLWPDSDETHSRGALRRTIHALSRVLPDDALVSAHDQIELADVPGLLIDVAQFSATYHDCVTQSAGCGMCAQRLADAVALYRSDFLSGFTLKDSVEFDDWQFFQTESLRRQQSALLAAHLRCIRAADDQELALETALRWARFDPLDEKPQIALMELLAAAGERAAALRQYDAYRHQLARELDAEPSGKLIRLHDEIKAGRWVPELSRGPIGETQAANHDRESRGPVVDRHPATILALRLVGVSQRDETTTRFMSALYGIALRFGGRIERQSGRSVLIVFGRTVTRENAPELSIRTALEARTTAGKAGQALAAGISSSVIGVPSDSDSGSDTVSGRAVTDALRLAALATSGEILVSEATFRATRGTVRYSVRRSNGEGPPAWRVQALQYDPVRDRGVEGVRTALVGRKVELERLRSAVDSVQNGSPRLVTVTGAAGVGKSRLVAEALELASSGDGPQVSVLRGRCLDLGVAAGYWPFMDMLRHHLHLPPQIDQAEEERRITESVADLARRGLLTDAECREVSACLVRLLSAGSDAEGQDVPDAEPQALRSAVFRSVARYLTSLAHAKPLLITLEDLHWADALSLELISYLMESLSATTPAVPIGIICIYRDDPAHRCRHLVGTARRKCPEHHVEISLEELNGVECRSMIAGLLGDLQPPREIESFIVERAQGNPFYVEELTRSLIERGILVRRKRGWSSAGETPSLLVPVSVESVIRANTDRLSGDAQLVLRCASVFGRVFDTTILTRMLERETDVGAALLQLEDLAFVHEERTVPRREYAFRHVLTREAVYRGIPEWNLRTLHARAAEEIRIAFGDRLESYYEQIAHHYEIAGNEPQAVQFLVEAGRKAIAASDNEAAIKLLQRALDIVRAWPSDEERGRRELEILVSLAVPVTATTGYGSEATEAVYRRANELAESERPSTSSFAAVFGLCRYVLIRGEIPQALELSRRLVARAEQSRIVTEQLEAKRVHGCALVHSGSIADGEKLLRDGLALYNAHDHRSNAFVYGHDPATTLLTYLALTHWVRGSPDQAIRTQDRLHALLQDSNHQVSLAYSLSTGTVVYALTGRCEQVLGMTERCMALAGEGHLLMFGSLGRALHGWALVRTGRRQEGIDDLRRGIAGMEEAGCAFVRVLIRTMLAQACLEDGLIDEMRSQLDAAIEETRNGELFFAPEAYRLRAGLALATGAIDIARQLLAQSADVARSIGGLSYELRTAMSLIELERSAGTSREAMGEAERRLQAAYDCFTEGFETADLRRAAALLGSKGAGAAPADSP